MPSDKPLHTDEGDPTVRLRPRWPAVLALFVVVGAGVAGYMFATAVHLVPNRVLIAVETVDLEGQKGRWWGARGAVSARYVDLMAKQFNRLGIETVPLSDEKLEARLDEGIAGFDSLMSSVAPEMGASFVVSGQIAMVAVDEMPASEREEATLEVSLALHSVGRGENAPIVSKDRFVRVVKAGESGAAAELALRNIVERHVTRIGAALAAQPELARLNNDKDPSFTREEFRIAGEVGRLFFVARQRKALFEKRTQEESDAVIREKKQGFESATRIGPVLGLESLVGYAGKDRLLLYSEERTLEVFPDANGYTNRAGRELLVSANLDGSDRKQLFSTYNIFSTPNVTPAGHRAVAVVDHYGWSSSLVVLNTADGHTTRIAEHASLTFSTPRISPDGSQVALWIRSCRRCPRVLEVIDVASKKRRVLVPPNFESMTVPTWTADSKTLYTALQPEGGQKSIFAIDVASSKARAVLGPEAGLDDAETDGEGGQDGQGTGRSDDHHASLYREVTIAPNGERLAVVEHAPDHSIHVGLYTIADASYRRVAAGRASNLHFSPDGTKIAAETSDTHSDRDAYPYDREIAVADVASGVARVVTFNKVDDRLLGWTPDSQAIYRSHQSRDPDTSSWNRRIYRTKIAKANGDGL